MTRQPTVSLRALAFVLTAVVVLLLLTSAVPAFGGNGEADDAIATYEVRSGDTLWSVAAANTPAGGDVRRTVAEIRDLSGLDGSTIRAGQTLRLPPS